MSDCDELARVLWIVAVGGLAQVVSLVVLFWRPAIILVG